MIRLLSIVLLLAYSSGLYAQKPGDKSSGSSARRPAVLSSGSSAQKPDSLKTKKILKQWNLSPDFSGEVNNPIDTVFSLFNRFRIADKYSPVNATPGNYGLPFYQINFFDRITDPDKYLYSTYYPFMHVPEKALFMNTQVPFTELLWTFAGKKETAEQTFRVRHSQNVNRFLNFGLIYDIIFDLGQYSYQRAEDKTFTFYSSYTGNKYKIYAAVAQKILDSLIAYQNKVGNHYIIKDVEFIANGMGITNFYSKHFLGFAAYMGKMELNGTIEWIEKQLNSPSTKLYKAIYYGSKKNAFKMVPVYDVTQTEPIDQNSFNPEDRDEKFLGPNAPDQLALPLLNAAVDWAKTASYQVGSEWKKGIKIDMAKEMAMGTGGWSENSGDIAINKMSQGWRQFATVVHEITHTLLHWGPDKGDITRSQKEIEAEATVYIVLDYFGYQDTQFVANYLNLHAKTGQDVLDRYEKIDKAARNIIKGINEFLNKKAANGNWFNYIKYSSLGLLNREINF